ncbi:MAG: DUF4157 domain-containing protein [Gammaproteobacteria bacterium]|nr:DUF4157 domain-containing protein [Gammaproteobacteria bacterium]
MKPISSQKTNAFMPRVSGLETEQGGITRRLDSHLPPLPVTRALGETVHPAATDDAERITGFGLPLPAGFRLWAERMFGVEMEDVRIHDDQQAHDQAEQQGAEALTFGNDILFSKGSYQPGNPEGDSLIVHELTHAVAQNEPGTQATVQRNGNGRQGIGSSPPSEPYVTMEGTGTEDGYVLFGQNMTDLDSGDTRTIRGLLTQHGGSGPVTVHIHGYSSREGDDTYNENLSAHRGVAVKTFLETILPEGSRVIVYAHGETTEFGNLADNRRVGIDFIQTRTENPLALNQGFPNIRLVPNLQLDLDFSGLEFQRRMLDLTIPSSTEEQTEQDPASPSIESIMRTPPSILQIPPVDHSSLIHLYTGRGVHRDNRDAVAAQEHFEYWYRQYILMGFSPDRAASLANLGTGVAVGSYLQHQHPTQQELLDRRMDTEITGGSYTFEFDLNDWLLNLRR